MDEKFCQFGTKNLATIASALYKLVSEHSPSLAMINHWPDLITRMER